MPAYFNTFNDLFISLGGILGVVVAIQHRTLQHDHVYRARVIRNFALIFVLCAMTVMPTVLFDFGLSEVAVWRVLSWAAILVVAGMLCSAALRPQTYFTGINHAWAIQALVGYTLTLALLAINLIGWWGPPSSRVFGPILTWSFLSAGTLFVMTALYRRPEPPTDHEEA